MQQDARLGEFPPFCKCIAQRDRRPNNHSEHQQGTRHVRPNRNFLVAEAGAENHLQIDGGGIEDRDRMNRRSSAVLQSWLFGNPPLTGEHRDSEHSAENDLSKAGMRSEEHTSELQSPDHLVCRLLLEKKKGTSRTINRASRTVTSKSTR